MLSKMVYNRYGKLCKFYVLELHDGYLAYYINGVYETYSSKEQFTDTLQRIVNKHGFVMNDQEVNYGR